MLYKKQKLLSLLEHLGSPPVFGYEISISQMAMDLFLFTYIFLSSIAAKTLTVLDCIQQCIWVTWWASYEKQELLALREPLDSPSVGFVLLIFLVFCAVFLCFCLSSSSVSCVSNVASVSGLSILDFPFVFSNVYSHTWIRRWTISDTVFVILDYYLLCSKQKQKINNVANAEPNIKLFYQINLPAISKKTSF